MTITLTWWMLPIALFVCGCFWVWRLGKASGRGMLNGIGETFMALAFFAAALVSLITGWIAS